MSIRAVPPIVAVLVAAVAFGAAEGSRASARRVAAQLGKSVVNIQVVSEENGVRVSCARFSGIVLDKDLVLACCPDVQAVVQRAKGCIELTYENLWSGKGFLTAVDEPTGLCLIRCEGNHEPPPSVTLAAQSVPKCGTRVLTVANPFGIERVVRYGTVRAPVFCGEDSSSHAYELLLAASPGEEGGIVCGLGGDFLGMIRPARCSGTSGGGFASVNGAWPQVTVLPGFAVSSIAKHLREGRRVLRGWIRARFTVTRVGDAQRVIVAAVSPGGPADTGGLKPGDVVLEANGKSITTLNDLADTGLWIEYEGVGKDLVLKVARQEDAGVTLKIAVGLKADDVKRDEEVKD